MSNKPLVPNSRLLEIIRAFTGNDPNNIDWESKGLTYLDMNSESNLLRLAQIIVDEAQARIPLWELEKQNDH